MTAINLTFTRDQALIVTDELRQVAGAPVGYFTKAHALPSLRLMFAGTGSSAMLQDALLALMWRSSETDVEALDREMPACLRRLWEQWGPCTIATTVYHVGVTAQDEIAAFRYCSPDWTSELLEPRVCYVSPGLETPTESEAVSTEETVATSRQSSAKPWVPTWRDRVRAIVDYIERQHQARPDQVAGRLQVTHLTPHVIYQYSPRELGSVLNVVAEVAA